jgi:hypothetical protein
MSGTAPPTGIIAPPFGLPNAQLSNPVTFRSHFPAFADPTLYPDPQVQVFLNLGEQMCSAWVWGQFQAIGEELVCAHFLAMMAYAMGGAGLVPGVGAVPGLARGIQTSKSVSKVSVGYNPQLTAVDGAGPWNLTVYGQMFAWWWRIVGAPPHEMLEFGLNDELNGMVWTWARGVMIGWSGAAAAV